uniref:Biotin--protein ligase 1, chloroplastic n=1 Tax=Noccaea caerulescens TaxID=107243 RepID=A0A1J3FJ13_NOCCA
MIGGILSTSTYRSKMFSVSIGIGLNEDNDQPSTCLNAALKDMAPTSDLFKREKFLVPFINLKHSLIYSWNEDLNLSRSFTIGHGYTGDGYVLDCIFSVLLVITGFLLCSH